ncbi:uncharacterized LOC100150025 [Danio rerio]|uniref:Uncharacterized LOC100150025 n=1 Tax=Danio rerio TaxID=7955 RepID=A0AB13AAV6_DANRE|nr:uncharacterized LOC100150025 [Danio rerio]|eukprot:XP_021336077.1 uncharacterized protein si:dkey-264b2.3 [Danio rerio]
MISNSEPYPPDVRPRRQIRQPAYLADYEVHGSGFVKRAPVSNRLSEYANEAVAPMSANVSRSSSPTSQPSYTDDLILQDVWPEPSGYESPGYDKQHFQVQQTSDIKSMCMQMKRDNDELRSSILPEILSALQGLKAENATLRQEIQQRSPSIQTPIPAPRTHLPPSVISHRSSRAHSGEVSTPQPARYEQLTEQMGDMTLNSRMSHVVDGHGVHSQRAHTYSAQPSGTGHYENVPLGPRYHYLQTEREFSPASRPELVPRMEKLHTQEQIYRGPKPTIPSLTAADPRQFSRLRMALENILPADASERFKYQILTDHLELEEALLVADSYCNSVRPYTDTMHALVKMYGQPHKLVLQSIAEVLESPNLKSGDVKSFKLFALRVRSLVSMLEQLGPEGVAELDCGSHVSRLQSKLPHELQISFKRYIHPLRITVPTLLHFADWLEYELQVQDDTAKAVMYAPPLPFKRREGRHEHKPSGRSTNILLGAGKPTAPTECRIPTLDSKPSSTKYREKSHAYCPYCDNSSHFLNGCLNFKELTKEQKEAWIRKNNRCWRCGRNHHASRCTLKALCKTCNRKHLLVLHDLNERVVSTSEETEPKENSCLVNTTKGTLYADRSVGSRRVLLKVSKVIIANGDASMETFAVLDDGSERTILLHAAAQQLKLQGQPEDLILRTVRQDQQVLHGTTVSFTVSPVSHPHKKYHIQHAFTAERLSLAEHTYPVAFLQKKYRHLAGLPLQQMDKVQPVLLIGSDYPHLLTPVEPVRLGPPGGPAAVKTRLGWTLQGPTQEVRRELSTHQCFFTSVLPNTDLFAHVERLWQMDVIPYRNNKIVTRSKLDKEAISLLQENTVRVEVQGTMRYATPLLRMQSMPCLNMPKEAVLPQLRSVERRLLKNPEQASAYQAEITRLKEAGYVAKLEPREADCSKESWYIPHHMVQHNNKNRVVYNCSFQFEGHSLNDFLLPGPTLSPSLLAVLLRFREHPVAISSDIRGMFHQVRLLPGDMPLLRFLWRDLKPDLPPDVYQWQVLPFGTTCSPCCASYALQTHVINHSQPGDRFREVIEKSFYVDNCLHSLHSPKEAKDLVDGLCALLASGGFELRQWASNCPSVITHLPPESRSSTCELWLSQDQQDVHESTLGLQWHCQTDTLRYKHRARSSAPVTMRHIYRVLASQYDPLGYIIPYTTRAKILVQRLWDKKRDWDDPHLPEDLLALWHEWEKELSGLEEISLARCYSLSEVDHASCKYEIHIFCDASEQAYGSVAYLRIEHKEGEVEVAFVAARSRVAPRKQQSIPRLELCAALSGAQLSQLLNTELTVPIHSTTLWSDSTTVLMWLTSSSCRYKVFVGTRVAEIQEMTASAVWRYVRSSDNPADDITRGKSLQNLSRDSRWSQGPSFLKLPSESWPEQPHLAAEGPNSELRKSSFSVLVTTTAPSAKLQHFNTLTECLNAYGQELHGAAYTSSAELQKDVQRAVLRQAQAESFPEELRLLMSGKSVSSKSRLLTLSPELDAATGLIRVGGRLRHCEVLEADTIHPVVLDPRHPVTLLIIRDYDERLHHPGTERLFAEIRRTYWILRGREAIRRYQHQCTECKKWRGRPEVPLMADLPLTRQRYFRPVFYSTGMDCFGPFVIKIGRRNEKRWGIVFKCMTTRAVHLDLLSSIDSDSFLMALRRFIARRGNPHELLCDQGTNFKGGERELNEAFAALQSELQNHLAVQQIKFTYNPPSAPHFGGCWEREIRSIKAALKVTIGAQTVTEEVLRTVLIEVEGILNSKPLGYTSSDVADLDPITPFCFLIGRRDVSLPQVVYEDSEILSRRRWRHSQLLAEHFWRHFLKYYLPDLQARQKWKTEKKTLEIGDVVMIVDPQLPRALWPVGRITQVFPGADGRVRTANVEVKGKTYTRIVARLIQLPALPEDE